MIELTDLTSSTRFEQLTDFLKNYMPDIRMKERHGDQITYVILDDAEHTRTFPKMLADLDENLARYHIKSYGLSNSSLEQVFLRVADEVKRIEDYERLSRWRRLVRWVRGRCRKTELHVEETQMENNAMEATDEQETFNSCLSGTYQSYV